MWWLSCIFKVRSQNTSLCVFSKCADRIVPRPNVGISATGIGGLLRLREWLPWPVLFPPTDSELAKGPAVRVIRFIGYVERPST
jgi:hypothetical protein